MSLIDKIPSLDTWKSRGFEPPNYTQPPGPAHYQQGTIEPIQFFLANPHIGWCEANAIKYLYRWRLKGGRRDLEKAKHYIQLLLDHDTKENPSAQTP